MHPPERIDQLRHRTYVSDAALGKLAIPLVLDFFDLSFAVCVDVDDGVDGLLFADSFDDVAGLEVHGDGISVGGDFVVETLDFGEGGLEAVLWVSLSVLRMAEFWSYLDWLTH